MSDTVLSVENLSKRYQIGREREPGYQTLRDVVMAAGRRLTSRLLHPRDRASRTNEFWALKDVSFAVGQGQVIGVIGRNGAGKSTLLKVLSRITEPTKGCVRIKGRVASLLEVGTGFHPELTGRENIFLNGAILGMGREEIRRKFEEIVAFAEVKDFLDTPVKRYSSGMYVRLAFAVAAHLEPEILIVDEVLAVGDAEFQKKCLGRMKEVGNDGRTVVFVSHNMAAVSALCSKGVWLDAGRVAANGEIRQVIGAYMSKGVNTSLHWRPEKSATREFTYHSVSIQSELALLEGEAVPAGTAFEIVFDYSVGDILSPGRLALLLTNQDGITVLTSANTDETRSSNQPWSCGRHVSKCVIPGHLLAPGRYYVTVSEPLGNGGDLIHDSILSFTVSNQNSLASRDGRLGVVMPILTWKVGSAQ